MSIEPGFVSSRQFIVRRGIRLKREDTLTIHFGSTQQISSPYLQRPRRIESKGPAERENRLLEGFNDWLVLFAAANQLTKGLKPVSVAWKQIFTNRKIDE